MKQHPAWLAAGLLVFVVLACNMGKRTANVNVNTNGNANRGSSGEIEDTGSGTHIEEINMARDNGRGDPGDETTTFRPSDHKIHCIVKLKEAKAGTGMRFSWWVVDSDGTQNKKIKDIDYTTRARENIVHAHLSLPDEWPTGNYKVQVYVNGDLDKTVAYTVE